MPRQVQVSPENSFIGGLITDSTALAFPTNACSETWDCEFDITGRITRRLGIDYESGYSTSTQTKVASQKFAEYLWTAVAGNGTTSFLVQQYGRYIYFYDVSTSATPSANKKSFNVDLNSYKPSGTTLTPSDYPCSFTQGNGILIIVNAATTPISVEYTGSGITKTGYELKERDFTGSVSDTWANTERKTTSLGDLITNYPDHFYNILNQGWFEDPLSQWDTARGDMPSNSDKVAFYRASEADSFDPARVTANTIFSGTRAPRGHFILTVAYPERSVALAAESGSYTITGDVRTYYRPSCTAFYTGRVWYAGINSVGVSSSIYFSQILENGIIELPKCYQVNDPTSEFSADLLPSDGGVIRIQEAGNIIKLFPLQAGLVVFADNGVWMIVGSTGGGFTANDYAIRKLSSVGTRAGQSVVDVKGTPVWWAEDGIYTLEPSQALVETYNVVSLTVNKLDTFYQSFPQFNKTYVKGTYDPLEYVVTWIYNDSTSLSSANYQVYNKILKLNVVTKAFFPQTIDTTSTPDVRGIVWVKAADSSAHGIKFTTTTSIDATTEYLLYSGQWDTTYHDWDTPGTAVDYTSYLITGYRIHGDTQRKFQANYIYTFMDMEDDASLYVQGHWGFSSAGDSGRWSSTQQVYKDRDNFAVSKTRRKIRGQGEALQLKYSSNANHPFTLLGWSTWETANAGI